MNPNTALCVAPTHVRTTANAGAPQGAEPELDGGTCRIELELGLGTGRASYLTSDLSYDYIRINADYRS